MWVQTLSAGCVFLPMPSCSVSSSLSSTSMRLHGSPLDYTARSFQLTGTFQPTLFFFKPFSNVGEYTVGVLAWWFESEVLLLFALQDIDITLSTWSHSRFSLLKFLHQDGAKSGDFLVRCVSKGKVLKVQWTVNWCNLPEQIFWKYFTATSTFLFPMSHTSKICRFPGLMLL